MKHCCPCEKCRKLRSKSNKRIGRVKAATKKAAAKKKKEKENRKGDTSCPHCDLEQGHEPGQVCKKLRKQNEEADGEKSKDKTHTRDLEKANRLLEKKLKEANKKVRSRSEPAPRREQEDATKLSDSDDETSYSVSDDDYSTDGESSEKSSKSSRGRKSKRGHLVRRRHIGVARYSRVKKIGSKVPAVTHVNPYTVYGYDDIRESDQSP